MVETAQEVEMQTTFARSDGAVDRRAETWQNGESVGGVPPWFAGPCPLKVERTIIGDSSVVPFVDSGSTAERTSLVSEVVAQRLYTTKQREHRAARPDDQHAFWAANSSDRGNPVDNVEVVAVELFRFASVAAPANALLIIHSRVSGADVSELFRGLRLAAMQDDPRRESGRRARAWIAHLARGVAELAPEHLQPYHLAFLSPEALPMLDSDNETDGWSREQQWLWSLATLQTRERYPAGPRNHQQLISATRALSADWQGTVLRRGAAMLTRAVDDPWEVRPDGSRQLGFLGEVAPLLVRSLYTDALLLGVAKQLMLQSFTSRMAALGDPVRDPVALATLDSDFTRFRNTLWWEDMGRSGHASLLLRSFDAAVGSARLHDRLVADLTDYSQKVESAAALRSNDIAQGTNALIGLVTCFGVPLGALQVFGTDGSWVWLSVAAYLVIVGLLPSGDQMIAGLLPAESRTTHGRRARLAWCSFWVLVFCFLFASGAIPIEDQRSESAPATGQAGEDAVATSPPSR